MEDKVGTESNLVINLNIHFQDASNFCADALIKNLNLRRHSPLESHIHRDIIDLEVDENVNKNTK